MNKILVSVSVGLLALVGMEYALTTSSAKLTKHYDTQGERAFVFSPRDKEWAAYDADGYYVAGGIANGGAEYCYDLQEPCHTPAGVYRVYRKGGADCVSGTFPLSKGGGAPMPYCMFFTGGYAIHGSPFISYQNTSHGCVRVNPDSAKWLSSYFLNHGTKVIIHPYE